MKTKLTTTLLALAAVSINLHAAPSTALPAPLPDFMDQAQLAKWNADKAATAQTASSSAPEYANQFYTGKPYVADAGGYIYKYRTYNPEMSRWTSADPSGFPDGANNQIFAGAPTLGFDPTGRSWTISGPNEGDDAIVFSDTANFTYSTSSGSNTDTVKAEGTISGTVNPNNTAEVLLAGEGTLSGPDFPANNGATTYTTGELNNNFKVTVSTDGTISVTPTGQASPAGSGPGGIQTAVAIGYSIAVNSPTSKTLTIQELVTSTWNGEGAITGDGWQGGVNIGAVGTSAGMDISWASGQGAMKETSDTISFNFTE